MSIEQHETELKELLTRIMRDPLQPLQAKLDQTSDDLASLDQQVKALCDVDLSRVSSRLDAIEKILKQLRSWSEEDAANEITDAMMPPIQLALDTLGTRLDSHAESIVKPLHGISHEVAQTNSSLARLSEHSAQGSALAVQRDANISDQVRELSTLQAQQARLMQVHVSEAAKAAVENLSERAASSNAAHEANLRRLVDEEVAVRIDKLMVLGRWAVGFAVAALSAATGCLLLLMPPLV